MVHSTWGAGSPEITQEKTTDNFSGTTLSVGPVKIRGKPAIKTKCCVSHSYPASRTSFKRKRLEHEWDALLNKTSFCLNKKVRVAMHVKINKLLTECSCSHGWLSNEASAGLVTWWGLQMTYINVMLLVVGIKEGSVCRVSQCINFKKEWDYWLRHLRNLMGYIMVTHELLFCQNCFTSKF